MLFTGASFGDTPAKTGTDAKSATRKVDLAAFDNPELRWVYGFSVNLKSFQRSDGVAAAAAKPNTFDFGFAVEREIARGSGLKIPSNTRYVIRGEMNLLRAFTGARPS
jgi:hypothetical protein